jgi:glucose-6-phosphate isomerase
MPLLIGCKMNKDFLNIISKATPVKERSITELFSDTKRAADFSVAVDDLFLDYSKQNINAAELDSLISFAKDSGLNNKIKAMFNGDKINNTENRAVLHTLLRAPQSIKKQVLGADADIVLSTELRMEKLVDELHSGQLKTASGDTFTDVIAIGIGGSYYGLKVALSALKPFHHDTIQTHVLANVDGAAVQEKLEKLNPKTTLVIVISKTFTTQETLLNAQAVKSWMLASIIDHSDENCESTKPNNITSEQGILSHIMQKQWLAVSSNIPKAIEFGLCESNIFPMWEWVGGRFSLWSAVGLPLALAIGNDNFSALKAGAYIMDKHFQTADHANNMPIILALIGLWNRNGLGCPSLAILPYDHALRALPGYLQQTDMESNGKSVSIRGEKLPWLTAPIVFGQEGTNGQHAFMQLMHQSDDIIPTDFIISLKGSSRYHQHHTVLVANCFAQSEALMQGKSLAQAKEGLSQSALSVEEIERLAPHKVMKGNTPSNTLVLNSLTPKSLGSLLALYEHKILVQGLLWQVNSFDQWGVELGKELGTEILAVMEGNDSTTLSSSTLSLIKQFLVK